jgi:hypothetical protein
MNATPHEEEAVETKPAGQLKTGPVVVAASVAKEVFAAVLEGDVGSDAATADAAVASCVASNTGAAVLIA